MRNRINIRIKKEDFIKKLGIKDGLPGKDGEDAIIDYEKIKNKVLKEIPKSKNGKDGEDAIIDYEKIKKIVIKEIPKPKNGEDGKDGSPDTGKEIVKKLDKLEKEDRLSYNSLKDTPTIFKGQPNVASKDISWGEILGTLSDQTDLQDALNLKFNKQEAELLFPRKTNLNLYTEFTKNAGGDIIQVDRWSTPAKTLKLFTDIFTYTDGDITQTERTDEITGKKLTKTFTYSGGEVINITSIIT